MHFLTVEPGDPMRRVVEDLIRSIYRDAYGADLAAFPRHLVALADAQGRPLCAAGLRLGWQASFSACYLDEDIEDVILRRTGRSVAPAAILEVTTLAGIGHGHAMQLIERVREIGRGLGMDCGVCTATAPLRRALRRAGYTVVELVPAVRERVGDPAAWGSYYDADPAVCLLDDVPVGHRAGRLPVGPALRTLLPGAVHA